MKCRPASNVVSTKVVALATHTRPLTVREAGSRTVTMKPDRLEVDPCTYTSASGRRKRSSRVLSLPQHGQSCTITSPELASCVTRAPVRFEKAACCTDVRREEEAIQIIFRLVVYQCVYDCMMTTPIFSSS